MTAKDLGMKIRIERVKKNMSMKDIAMKLGVCEQTISRYEKGETEISVTTLDKILKILNVDIAIFFKN